MSNQSRSHDAKDLLQLSREVSRIATALARLSEASPASPAGEQVRSDCDLPEPWAKRVEAAVRARKLRLQYISAGLLGEPAWDMLLELLHAKATRRAVAVRDLAAAAGVSPAAAERWIGTLVHEKMAVRHDSHIEISAAGTESLLSYFEALGEEAGS